MICAGVGTAGQAASSLGSGAQVARCREWADYRGHRATEVITDDGMSGNRFDITPESRCTTRRSCRPLTRSAGRSRSTPGPIQAISFRGPVLSFENRDALPSGATTGPAEGLQRLLSSPEMGDQRSRSSKGALRTRARSSLPRVFTSG